MATIFNYVYQSLASLFSTALPKAIDIMVEMPPFTAADWCAHLNTDVDPSDMPEELVSFLETPCCVWPDKLRKETHIVCFVAKNVTLKSLFQSAGGQSNSPFLEESICSIPTREAYWIAVTKKPLPDTAYQSFDEQQKIAKHYGYEVPSLVELGVSIQAAKVNRIPIFFGEGNFSRSKEIFNKCPIAIGMETRNPFSILLNDWNEGSGLAGVMRFK